MRAVDDNQNPAVEHSRLELGGYEIRIDQPAREFRARYVLGRVSVLARAVRSDF